MMAMRHSSNTMRHPSTLFWRSRSRGAAFSWLSADREGS
jgi:hypothetical protein